MLHADLVIGTDDRPLEKAPHAFDGIGMHIPMNPPALVVIDGLVVGVVVTDPSIGLPFIRVDGLGFRVRMLLDETVESLAIRPPDHLENDLPLALDGPDNERFVPLVGVPLSAHLATNPGFIDFDDAPKGSRIGILHRGPDAVAEIPRGLVAHVNRSLDLVRGNALLGLDHEVGGQEPLGKRELGIVEDGSRGHGKLVIAI